MSSRFHVFALPLQSAGRVVFLWCLKRQALISLGTRRGVSTLYESWSVDGCSAWNLTFSTSWTSQSAVKAAGWGQQSRMVRKGEVKGRLRRARCCDVGIIQAPQQLQHPVWLLGADPPACEPHECRDIGTSRHGLTGPRRRWRRNTATNSGRI